MAVNFSTGRSSGLSAIAPLSGQILDSGLERGFRSSIWSEQTRNIRVSVLLGAAALLVSMIVDLFRAPDGSAVTWIIGSHAGVFLMCAVVYFLSLKPKPVQSLPWAQVGLATAFSFASAAVILSGTVPWSEYAVTEALAIVFFVFVLPNWMVQIYWSVGVLVAGYIFAMPTAEFGVGIVQIVVTEILIATVGLFVIKRILVRGKVGFLRREQLARSRDETQAELDETRFQREAFEQTAVESVSVMEEIEFMRQDMEQQATFLTTVLDNISQGVSVFDREYKLAVWNKGFGELLELPEEMLISGLSLEDVVTHNIKDVVKEGDDRQYELNTTMMQFRNTAEGDQIPCSFERIRSDGTAFEVEGHPMPGGGLVLTFTDITEQKKTEAAIRQLAETDALTGLANRAAFDGALAQAMAATAAGAVAAESGGEKTILALAMLDLDGFKPVNDNFGHPVGDEVLRKVAEAIRDSVRDSDIVARLGGDEFAIIYKQIRRTEDVQIPLQRLIEKLEDPISVGGHAIRIGISAGLACFPDDAEDQEALVKRADDALYQAKRAGKGRLHLAAG